MRTSLASRTHFEVLGLEGQILGLEPLSPRELLDSRTAIFFELLKFCRSPKKKIFKTFYLFIYLFIFCFGPCPWSLASSIPILSLERVCPREGCPWPWIFFVSLAFASSLVSSTPSLLSHIN